MENIVTDVTDMRVTGSNLHLLEARGWFIAAEAIPSTLIGGLTAKMDESLKVRESIREENGVDGDNDGTLHHLLGDHPIYVTLLERYEEFDSLLRSYFLGNYILNSYGGVINRRDTSAYVHQIHRDIRFSSPTKRFMLNSLVMLDHFTVENGATYVLSGSHNSDSRPNEHTFVAEAERATGPRGSILFFDSRLWHAAGKNETDEPRRALTLTFTSPFFKQQLDYPRMMAQQNADEFSPFLRQVIGFNSRVPATLSEYYVPVSQRFYQRGQDE